MVTKSYVLLRTIQCIAAIARLCEVIPCFIDTRPVSNNHFELTVRCRQEDVITVERYLARHT